MFDWLTSLPVVWIALWSLLYVGLLTPAIYALVMHLAVVDERCRRHAGRLSRDAGRRWGSCSR